MISTLGKHLIFEMEGATNLQDPELGKKALKEAAEKAGATVLSVTVHDFKTEDMDQSGFSGVAVLAESHISVHTWPEFGYAAFDVFMCGDSDPVIAMNVLQEFFDPKEIHSEMIERFSKKDIIETNKINVENKDN